MAIYSKTLSPEWREAFREYEALCGFEPMFQEDVDTGEMTARQAWNANIQWLECVVGDVANIPTPYDEEEE